MNRYIVRFDPDTSSWVAVDPDLDLVSQGFSPTEALGNLLECVAEALAHDTPEQLRARRMERTCKRWDAVLRGLVNGDGQP